MKDREIEGITERSRFYGETDEEYDDEERERNGESGRKGLRK
mgnify:CR=1 FL=1